METTVQTSMATLPPTASTTILESSTNATAVEKALAFVVKELKADHFNYQFLKGFAVAFVVGLITVVVMERRNKSKEAAVAEEEQAESEEEGTDAEKMVAVFGYKGGVDEAGQPHGFGEIEWDDGDSYEVSCC
jgi:hypothetical protein